MGDKMPGPRCDDFTTAGLWNFPKRFQYFGVIEPGACPSPIFDILNFANLLSYGHLRNLLSSPEREICAQFIGDFDRTKKCLLFWCCWRNMVKDPGRYFYRADIASRRGRHASQHVRYFQVVRNPL